MIMIVVELGIVVYLVVVEKGWWCSSLLLWLLKILSWLNILK